MAPASAPRFLAILGMHRSGTSAVAQACAASGISAGPAQDLLSGQADNPQGFYEHRGIVALNDELLERASASWFSPPAQALSCNKTPSEKAPAEQAPSEKAPSEKAPCSKTWCERAAALIESLSRQTSAQLLVKDPRLCLTWPAWAPLLPSATLLYVYRSPLTVARSLQRRNGFPLQFGLMLWEAYNRAALEHLRAADYLAVAYDAILAGDQDLPVLLGELSGRGFDCAPERAADVFKAELGHHRRDEFDSADEALLSAGQRRLVAECERCVNSARAGEPGSPVLSRKAALDEHRGLRQSDPELDATLANSSLDDAAALHARIADFAGSLKPLARLVETGRERDAALDLAQERTSERDRSLATLSRLETEHAALAEAHRALEADRAHLQRLHDELHKDFDERGAALNAASDALSRLEAEHRALNAKAEYLFTSLSESYGSLLHFEQSAMAATQRLARRLYRLLTLQRGRSSPYEHLLARAHEHVSEHGIEVPEKSPDKLSLAIQVIRYGCRNPMGSVRSFSGPRLRRAMAVFFGRSPEALAVWIKARFPEADLDAGRLDAGRLDPEQDPDLDGLELEFPRSDKPRVSIIVPVFNAYRVTVNALRALHAHSAGVAYEVIVGDDGSTDLTTSLTQRLRGVQVSLTPRNLRFLGNCNLAARRARGEYLVFLNNDTVVTRGWLEALLAPFAQADVGITGPKLLFADGRLQEAGGIIWRDASGWNFGRADDAAKPAYNYLKEVDYVSGACLAIRRSLWRSLGGFDERFAPAYYEDADLCFAARAAGFRVVYQPHSVVYHFEGVSNGRDLSQGVKRHQVSNQRVFRDKWQAVLDTEHAPNGQRVLQARDRSGGKPCVLLIDHYVPHYDRDAGGRSTLQYLELLLRLGCRVQFMGANFFPHEPYTRRLQSMGVEVLVGESIARRLDQWLAEHAPAIDEIFLHRPHVAEQFLAHLEAMRPRPRIHYFGHDLHFLRLEREAALKGDKHLAREAERWLQRETAVFERVDRVYYFSSAEIEALAGRVPAPKLGCVPLYAMELGELPAYAPRAPAHLLFVGGYNHSPNVDAALWLVREILPAVRERVPGVHLHLVGSNPPAQILNLRGARVTVHAALSDEALHEKYREVGAAVAPLRYGAGVKGKVIEAIAQHLPVVTTPIGAEGIPDSESVLWIENSAPRIAQRLVAILTGREDIQAKLARHERWLRRHFDSRRAREQLCRDIPALRALA